MGKMFNDKEKRKIERWQKHYIKCCTKHDLSVYGEARLGKDYVHKPQSFFLDVRDLKDLMERADIMSDYYISSNSVLTTSLSFEDMAAILGLDINRKNWSLFSTDNNRRISFMAGGRGKYAHLSSEGNACYLDDIAKAGSFYDIEEKLGLEQFKSQLVEASFKDLNLGSAFMQGIFVEILKRNASLYVPHVVRYNPNKDLPKEMEYKEVESFSILSGIGSRIKKQA